MLRSTLFVPLALVAAATLALSGCPGNHSNFSPSRTTSPAILATNSSGAPAPAQHEPHSSPKHFRHDSEFTVYRNPDYGVSFRYPRNFALLEQSEAGDSEPGAIQAQQDLAAEQPGALLVATVSIPGDAYPNTTFRSGTLEFVVNPAVTPEACYSFAAPPESDWYGTTGTVITQGITLYWQEESSSGPDNAYQQRTYAGFSNGACYEFRIEVDASDNFDPNSETRPADVSKIMRTLDKIVLSFQLHPTPVAPPAPAPLPASSPVLTALSSAPFPSIRMITIK